MFLNEKHHHSLYNIIAFLILSYFQIKYFRIASTSDIDIQNVATVYNVVLRQKMQVSDRKYILLKKYHISNIIRIPPPRPMDVFV